jgi:hypothetical protein
MPSPEILAEVQVDPSTLMRHEVIFWMSDAFRGMPGDTLEAFMTELEEGGEG